MGIVRIGVDAVVLASRMRGEAEEVDGVARGTARTERAPLNTQPRTRQRAGKPRGFLEIADRLTKWIPTETLALYIPGVTLLHAEQNPSPPAFWFLAVMTCATPIFVVLAAWGANRKMGNETIVAALLATIAFIIWSCSVPFNGWQTFELISENSRAVAVIAAVTGLLFGQFAETLSTRIGLISKS